MAAKRLLPPLNALRAFEATVRNGSLTRAAVELRVTQGAVSRHVSQLEEWLGVKLCLRLHRGIESTSEGAALAGVLRTAFDDVEAQVRRIQRRPRPNTLRIKLPPTFAIRWFVPRLARFHALHRSVDVQITTSHHTVNFDSEDVDVCIHWGEEPIPGMNCRRLFGETLLPVCSPGLLEKGGAVDGPRDLRRHVLLCSMHRPDDWPIWLEAAGIDEIDGNSGLKFENSALAYQAAVDELGIVMAQHTFVEEDLRTGRLVAPLPLRVDGPSAYYLVYPKGRRPSAALAAFEGWIIEQVTADRTNGSVAV